MKTHAILSVLIVLAAACTPGRPRTPEPAFLPPDSSVTSSPIATGAPDTSFSPNPGDTKLERGSVFMSNSELLIRESYPVQIALVLSGELPTPCHQLRVNMNPPDAENKIQVEAYTVFDPAMNCIQVLKPFQENVELGTFPSGHYTVWVNENQVGEFDS